MSRTRKRSLQAQAHEMMVHRARRNRKWRKRAGRPDARDFQPVGKLESVSRRIPDLGFDPNKNRRQYSSTGPLKTALEVAFEQRQDTAG